MTQTPQRCYLVFQCYGNEGVFLECAFALLSLSRLYKPAELHNWEIWIYTDQPEWYSRFKDCPLPLHFRGIDQQTIKQWRGAIDFVHRVKIEVLADFTMERSGNVLYADTDVIFTHPLDHIWDDLSEGRLYMHMMEHKISDNSNPLLKKLNSFLHKSATLQMNNVPLYDMYMWNAGVLGFNTTNKNLLTDVLRFTDTQYPQFRKHIIEQFAFSVYFQSTGKLKSALPYFLHYWNMKEARLVFASFFQHFSNNTWQELVAYSGTIQMYELVLQKIRFQKNLTLAGKLMHHQWKPEPFDWDELVKQV